MSSSNRVDYTNRPLPTPPLSGNSSSAPSDKKKTDATTDKAKRIAERQRRDSTPHPSKFKGSVTPKK